ncbi:MAG: trypsin-like peptidase domain-containing protein [Fimbriimonadaceae bacterium]|nr:trypsin-like peptidase domain-containing protein [Fimbriimonadaceae bacterium]
MKKLGMSLSLLTCLLILGCGGRTEPERLDHEMITALGQAATVKIYSYGDITLTGPYDVKLRTSTSFNSYTFYTTQRTILDNRVSEDRSKGLVPDGMVDSEYAFRVLTKSPDDFLEPTLQSDEFEMKNRPYSEGSGVVVDPSGVILTNKHVVADGQIPADSIVLAVAQVVIKDLEDRYYLKPSSATRQNAIYAVAQWLSPQIKATVKFRSVRVLFPKKRPLEDLPEREEVTTSSLAEFFPSHEESIIQNTSEAKVLASGTIYPGKDVAVLKCEAKNLIAIELGDSSQVSAGANVYCFGFPGAAVDTGMRLRATYLCVIHDGRVGQIMPMEGNWNLIHMTAGIHHGDSGGPVLNDKGKLIGLNVAGKEDAPEQNYAIPIEVAKEFLKEAGVEPKPGKAAKEWREALLDFYSNDKNSAYDRLVKIDEMINGKLGPMKGTADQVRTMSENRYVHEKLVQAKQASKQ